MTNRSGQLLATKDVLINDLVEDLNYDIREDGTIWTLITTTGKKSVTGTWREAGHLKPNGYRCIKYNGINIQIHRIIYQKFVGLLEIDLMINHKNGQRSDNRPENLELVPQSANNLHRFQVLKRPAVIGNKKISKEIADQIRADRTNGMNYPQLMAKYNLGKTNISMICNNLIWK